LKVINNSSILLEIYWQNSSILLYFLFLGLHLDAQRQKLPVYKTKQSLFYLLEKHQVRAKLFFWFRGTVECSVDLISTPDSQRYSSNNVLAIMMRIFLFFYLCRISLKVICGFMQYTSWIKKEIAHKKIFRGPLLIGPAAFPIGVRLFL